MQAFGYVKGNIPAELPRDLVIRQGYISHLEAGYGKDALFAVGGLDLRHAGFEVLAVDDDTFARY